MSWLFRRGSPSAAVNSVINARKNAATKGLSSALTKLANSIRKIRRNNPLENGTNRNNLMTLTANNRTNVNRQIQNYIMAVNKASYKNMKAQNAIQQTQNGNIPESAAIPHVNEAAKANENVANNGKKLNQLAIQAPRQANQRPANQRPANQRPANQRPANQRPANQRPANQRPANQRPANQAPPPESSSNNTPRSVKILRTYLANHKSNNAPNKQIEMLNRYRANANSSGKMNNTLRTNVNTRLEHLRKLTRAGNLNSLLTKIKSPNYLNSLKTPSETGAVSTNIYRLAKEQGVEKRQNVQNAMRALAMQTKKQLITQFTNDMIANNADVQNAISAIKTNSPKYNWSKINPAGLTNKQRQILNGLKI